MGGFSEGYSYKKKILLNLKHGFVYEDNLYIVFQKCVVIDNAAHLGHVSHGLFFSALWRYD